MKTPDRPSANAMASELAATRLAEFRNLRARGALCSGVSEQMAAEATDVLINEWVATGAYIEDAVTLLAEMATLEQPCASDPDQQPVFPAFVERLSDAFDPALCDLYDRTFLQMLSVARGLPAALRLDAALNEFGLHGQEDLLKRKAALGERSPWRNLEEHHRVRKALVLSRVTLGADVAITSIILQRARQLFPNATRVLLAPSKAQELFGGDPTLAVRAVPYCGNGTLLERLHSWLDLLDAIRAEISDLSPHEYVVLDPDSRYLQLGLLPAVRDESRYCFFESRRAGSGGDASLSRLTNDWMNETFGSNEMLLPQLALRKQDKDSGIEFCRQLGEGGTEYIVAMSFGVGGNNEKRLTDAFEEQLVARLIADGATIILDQGAGEEEAARARRIAESVRSRGDLVSTFNAGASQPPKHSPLKCKLVMWQGGIGAWAGVIAASSQFVGYDSAGQHLAAAMGVPSIDIFTANTSQRFRQRWHPSGDAARALVVGPSEDVEPQDAFLEKVLAVHRGVRTLRAR